MHKLENELSSYQFLNPFNDNHTKDSNLHIDKSTQITHRSNLDSSIRKQLLFDNLDNSNKLMIKNDLSIKSE